jgi:hypothetical protein
MVVSRRLLASQPQQYRAKLTPFLTGFVAGDRVVAVSDHGTPRRRRSAFTRTTGGLGRSLLGVTAAGFVAYGFYQIVHARYLHIRLKR